MNDFLTCVIFCCQNQPLPAEKEVRCRLHCHHHIRMSTMKYPNNWTVFKLRLHKSFKKCPSFIERKQVRHS